MTKKIAINTGYGGFYLSAEGENLYTKLTNIIPIYPYSFSREDKYLIQVIETLGQKAGSVKIVEIPSDVDYTIEDYDGMEWIAEVHRTWR